MQKITPFLWYDGTVEEAINFCCSLFPKSKVLHTSPGPGGPHLKFAPAVSMYVNCESQAEVDELWAKLSEGSTESQCGRLVD